MEKTLDLNILEEYGFIKGITGNPHAIRYDNDQFSIYIEKGVYTIGIYKGQIYYVGKIKDRNALEVILEGIGILKR